MKPASAISFTLNGKPAAVKPTPKMVERTMVFLESSKFGELFSTKELAEKLGYTVQSFRNAVSLNPLMAQNFVRMRIEMQQMVWGSKRTIVELKRQLERQ